MASLEDRYAAARSTLAAAEQDHLLTFYADLDDVKREMLLTDIEGIDWPEIAELVRSHVLQAPVFNLPEHIEPAPWYPNLPAKKSQKELYRKARKRGEKLIAAGKVAAFTVAGGQGTRLGWDGPKGTFPATAVRKLPLFGCMAEYIRKAQQTWGATIPWYIMTSHVNDADTRRFFEEKGYFGLDPANVCMFKQGMMPAIDMATGKALLEDRHRLALSPNGHGGSLRSLYASGSIDDMKQRGIEHVSYTQVDNPIVKVVDPLFLGLHSLDGAEMSSKMLPKAYPKEKLGNFCVIDGRMTVIEYSDLPDAYAEQRTEDGELRFRAGSIAIHLLRVDFVEKINQGSATADGGLAFGLPFHRAEKKVPYIEIDTGKPIKPAANNAVKLEMFVFDALPLCETSIIYETDRVEEFAPIKNADGEGAVDCPATSIESQTRRAANWLEANDVTIPRTSAGGVDAEIEISHLTAIEAAQLEDADLPDEIEAGTSILL